MFKDDNEVVQFHCDKSSYYMAFYNAMKNNEAPWIDRRDLFFMPYHLLDDIMEL